jgi:hypothetical protein
MMILLVSLVTSFRETYRKIEVRNFWIHGGKGKINFEIRMFNFEFLYKTRCHSERSEETMR